VQLLLGSEILLIKPSIKKILFKIQFIHHRFLQQRTDRPARLAVNVTIVSRQRLPTLIYHSDLPRIFIKRRTASAS
jgi:hypothetical protein